MVNGNKKMTDLKTKILKGLDLVSSKLIEESMIKKEDLVVLRNNKIVRIKSPK